VGSHRLKKCRIGPLTSPATERQQPTHWGNIPGLLKRNLAAATATILAGAALFLGVGSGVSVNVLWPWPGRIRLGQRPGAALLPDPQDHGALDQRNSHEGLTLKAAPGSTWRPPVGKGFPVEPAIAYQWQRNGAAINGAVASTYKLTAAEVGRKIAVTMLINLFDGRLKISWTSAATGTVIAPTVLNVVKPSVRGLAFVGRTLSVSAGTWRVAPTRYSYQWLRNGIAIKGATGSTYGLTTADKGRKVSVKVVAAIAGYLSGSGISGATAIVR
jgi:hypothetical protein